MRQMSAVEEQMTEKFLIDLLLALKTQGKKFIEVFGPKIYDVKVYSKVEKGVSHEKQYMLDNDVFDIMTNDLKMELGEDIKMSALQYLGNRYRDVIMFEYDEVERLSSIALVDPGEVYNYLCPLTEDLTLSDLNSKSFRLINRIRRYMTIK